jgi:hypothetical protein
MAPRFVYIVPSTVGLALVLMLGYSRNPPNTRRRLGSFLEMSITHPTHIHTEDIVHESNTNIEECPYRRPWNNDKTWTSLIEANQFRPCTDVWITGLMDQGGFGSDLHV